MIIIAFAPKTSKIMANIICKNIKHVAPIKINDDCLEMYQFVRPGHTEIIKLKMRDITILTQMGWKFIYMPINMPHNTQTQQALTCVQMVKRVIGLKKWRIQTPDALYKFLR